MVKLLNSIESWSFAIGVNAMVSVKSASVVDKLLLREAILFISSRLMHVIIVRSTNSIKV